MRPGRTRREPRVKVRVQAHESEREESEGTGSSFEMRAQGDDLGKYRFCESREHTAGRSDECSARADVDAGREEDPKQYRAPDWERALATRPAMN